MANLEHYKKDFILFVEAGFIAVNQGDEDSALKMFRAAQLLEPANTLPLVGKGYIHLCKLELRMAIEDFEAVLKKEPHNEMAKTFLGLSMALNPQEVAKGEKVLEECATKSHDKGIKNLASNAIDFVEKFIKKPTPMGTPLPPKKEKK